VVGRLSPLQVFAIGLVVAVFLSYGTAVVVSMALIGEVPVHVRVNAVVTALLVASLVLALLSVLIGCLKRQVARRERAEEELLLTNEYLESLVEGRTRQLEAARVEAERASQAKTLFLASASHDLRQPLQALELNYALIAHLLPENHPAVRMGTQAMRKLSGQLDDLLDLATFDSGGVRVELADVAVEDMLDEVVATQRPLAEAKGVCLRRVPSRRVVRTDRRLIERIIANLIANAVRYTDCGGVLVGVRSHDGRPWIEVWDSGIGIDAEHLSVIFDEFHQIDNPSRNSTGGSGLGLAIVERAAKTLGLPIRVASILGKGSVFAIGLD
jgi:signal transduction histidine kinase